MKTFRVIIIDDEQPARENLKSLLLLLYPQVLIVAEASSFEDAVMVLTHYEADIVFIDINIGDSTGFEVLDEVNRNFQIQPVFVTGHDEYALQAFKYAALAYLLKPVTITDLQETVDRILQNRQQVSLHKFSDLLSILSEKNTLSKEQKLFISDRNGWQVILVGQISYLEADGSYCKFHLTDNRLLVSSRNMKFYEQQLEGAPFLKIHKSYIVNKDGIQSYNSTNNILVLQGGKQLPVTLSAKEMRAAMG